MPKRIVDFYPEVDEALRQLTDMKIQEGDDYLDSDVFIEMLRQIRTHLMGFMDCQEEVYRRHANNIIRQIEALMIETDVAQYIEDFPVEDYEECPRCLNEVIIDSPDGLVRCGLCEGRYRILKEARS